jgi:hypothetical protein
MMRETENANATFPTLPADKVGGGVWGVVGIKKAALVILLLIVLAAPAWAGANFDLTSAAGGITLTQVGNNYIASFGTLNALGIGTPAAGVTVIPLNNGALYFTPYNLFVHGGLPAGHSGTVSAFASSNFGHPIALILQSCPSTSSCNTAGQFSNMSINTGAQTTVVPAPGIVKGQTVAAGLAIFVPDNNGANAFSGTDSATISFTMTDFTTGTVIETLQLSLNNPSETLQTAVRLTLATATGGLTITPGADFSMNFGNVNGLGFGPGAGLTTVAAAGGVVYSTPYVLQPAFTDFNSTTSTIRAFVSTTFAHPAILILRDAANSTGPFNNIGTTAGTATQITSTAASRSSITRFLGLFVSNTNGATAFQGSDAATLTFTITVP